MDDIFDAAEKPLDNLRQDLRLTRSAPLLNGQSAWIIFDPLRHRYFQVGLRVFELLSIWQAVVPSQLCAIAKHKLGQEYSTDEVDAVQSFLTQNELVDRTNSNLAQELSQKEILGKQGIVGRMVHNYLFFRVPLVRPDRFLRSTLLFVSPLLSRGFAVFIVLLALVGLYLVSRQWSEVTAAFLYFLTWEGLILFGLTLAFVKTVHELAHGYMATRFGVRVPVMGVAFLLLFPLLYTDVSDAWRLRSRKEKLLIDGAGIMAELSLAAIATVVWVLLPDGGLRSAAFFVATTSWTLSLLVNLNPLMRFDGYFLLADALSITNLQEKSFDLGKWLLREILFGLGEEPPEDVSRANAIQLAIYAWLVWIYRFFLFLGIAILVYYATFKVLGIILFLAEIIWLIAIPIFKEFKNWWALKGKIMSNPRSLVLPAMIAGFVVFLFLPIDRSVSVPAIIQSEKQSRIFPPFTAKLETMNVQPGQEVKKGDLLFIFSNEEREFALKQSKLRSQTLDNRLSRISTDESDLAVSLVLERELATEKQRAKGITEELEKLTVRAPFDGIVAEQASDLRPGLVISADEAVALVISNQRSRIKGLVGESELSRLRKGAEGKFIPDDPLEDVLDVTLAEISHVAERQISELVLVSQFGGPILVEQDDNNEFRPVAGTYALKFDVTDGLAATRITKGVVVLDAKAKNYISDIFRGVLKVLIRESGG